MASLPLALGAATGGVFAATKGGSGNKEDESFWDWILGKLQKEDQFYETDPILKKVEDKNSGTGTTIRGKKGTVSVSTKKKNGGFGGLFAKK